ncbi:MAG: ABC transporter permease [Candidatus Saccharimonadales bacterium]
MHNLRTVINFEIIRTLKKKSFWIMALAFPLMLGVIMMIIVFSNTATQEAALNTEKQKFSIMYKDDSHQVDTTFATALGATPVETKDAGIDAVKQGRADAFFYYPTDLSTASVDVYARDVGLFDNGRYGAVAKTILQESATKAVAPNLRSVLAGTVSYTSAYYKDGEVYDGFKQLIAPGVFLVLFYILIAMFGNQMLTSTTEEKENRVIEMILTTIEARTLIIGKIISLIVLAFIQSLVIMIPSLIAYFALKDRLSLPSLDLSSIPIDPARVAIGAVVFVASFILFTGLLVTIGSASPTAKEAGGFLGIVMVGIFGPLYAAPLFVSSPDSPFVQALSYFPLTAPIPLLLRNAVGNLSLGEALIAVVILSISAGIIIKIAVNVFRYGALQYSRRLQLKEILRLS